MRYLSVCSGIEAATVAWHPLGWTPAAFSEIDPFALAVLAHHFPDVPLHGDFTTIRGDEYGSVDLLVGGTPCQSFSVAGLRGGLDDDRGNLALEFLRLADRCRPRWLVWENVPGVLSSNGGRDFGTILGGMVELGYGFAYRVLDAQFFGVPQRRRRVFVVGYLGDARRAAAVLFERASLSGHPSPRRQARGDVAGSLTSRPKGKPGHPESVSGGLGTDFDLNGGVIASAPTSSIGRHGHSSPRGDASDNLILAFSNTAGGTNLGIDEENGMAPPLTTLHGDPTMIAFSCKDSGNDASDIAPTLRAMEYDGSHANAGGQIAVAFAPSAAPNARGQFACVSDDLFPTLKSNDGGNAVPAVAFQTSQSGVRVDDTHATLDANNGSRRHNGVIASPRARRLMPIECERLQGFPDGYTLVPYGKKKKLAADGPRFRALGNSMAIPPMRWIGERIAMVDAIAEDGAA